MKPPEILELEKELGFELTETPKPENLWFYSKTYIIDETNEVVCLNLNQSLKEEDIIRLKIFKNLQTLYLNLNEIEDIKPLEKLKNLQTLYLDSNYIENIKPLEKLKNLQELSLNSNQIHDLTSIGFLQNLKKLSLVLNNIIDITPLNKLKNLNELVLLTTKIQDISPLEALNNLHLLYLINHFQDIRPLIKVLRKLKNLEFFGLGLNNTITQDIVPIVSTLKKLKNIKKLRLNGNKLQNIYSLAALKNLEDIDLLDNQIQHISPLTTLKNLQKLNLSTNQIQNISLNFLDSFHKLESLILFENPIENIPKEIFDKEYINILLPVRTYLQDLERGKSQNSDVKILLLGNGGVGKTQIAKRLAEQERFVFNAQHDSTHGIVLLQRELENLNLNIWDFAGQDIYHATHRLFMQTRALFVLVWDVASETRPHHEHAGKRYKNEKLQYWLEYARCFAPESPILVVQNKVDTPDETEQTYLEQTLEYYKAHYPIIEFVQVSAKTGYNLDVLEYWLAESFRQDENLKRQLLIDIPTSWANVRTSIRTKQTEQEKTLSVEDFKTLCADEDIPDSWHTLLQYLHDTSVLYYREGYFGNQIILDQAWAIDAVYAVLNRQSFYFRTGKIKKGRLQYADLQILWKENADEERKLFIDFMLSTELCFETTEGKSYGTTFSARTFVVPQLLPEDKPKAVEFEESERNISQISEVVPYRFLPSVFIQRFIIKANRFSEVEMMWQHGILLQWNNFYAVVEADYDKKEIVIHANDAFLIQKIKEELELIENEGNVKVMKRAAGADFIEKGERFLMYGLEGLQKTKTIDNQYFAKLEVEGLQNQLEILIRRRNFYLKEQAIASDATIKFSLKMQLEDLEKEIVACRQKLQQ